MRQTSVQRLPRPKMPVSTHLSISITKTPAVVIYERNRAIDFLETKGATNAPLVRVTKCLFITYEKNALIVLISSFTTLS